MLCPRKIYLVQLPQPTEIPDTLCLDRGNLYDYTKSRYFDT